MMGGHGRRHSAADLSLGDLLDFVKRKAPSLGSLLVGILVGLLVAQTFSREVRAGAR